MKFATKLLFLSLVFITCSACSTKPHEWNGSVYRPSPPAPDLRLTTTERETFILEELKGKVVLIYFGYTFCPDVCPATLAEVKLIFEDLGVTSDKAVFVMVTIDPDRDTDSVLRRYLSRHHPDFIGLRGDEEELTSIYKSFGVYAAKDPSTDPGIYTMTHTARIFLIDKDGHLRTNYDFGTPGEEIQADLEYALEGT